VLAADLEVTFFGAFDWDRALPADVLELLPVDLLLSVEDAFLAAFGLVTFGFAISNFLSFLLLSLISGQPGITKLICGPVTY
jgi:hypothetical protein